MEVYNEHGEHEVINDEHPRFNAWAATAADIWQDGSGTYVPQTLEDTEWQQVLTEAGITTGDLPTKADLLAAWATQESELHWGGGHPETPFRMHEGGADESGSLSFSQILYKSRYGPRPCAAHSDMALNFYDPSDQLRAFVAHTASSNGSTATTGSCHGGMHLAFSGNNPMREEYNQRLRIDGGVNQMADFRGYIDNSTGAFVARAQGSREDDYEALAKAIAFYNGASLWMRNFTWPRAIRYLQYDEDSTRNIGAGGRDGNYTADGTCHSCKYSIEVRNQAGLFAGRLRDYVWLGGIATADINTDADPEVEIRAGEEWCFVYGESEWITHETVLDEGTGQQRRKIFSDFMEDAEDNNLLKTVYG
ncbi:hypothetical protein GCM10011297_35080 [Bacterioplanes sanyensis]|nr:hypothetical protein GCM10011297_35080 [Bacterioplanes sanyensis]